MISCANQILTLISVAVLSKLLVFISQVLSIVTCVLMPSITQFLFYFSKFRNITVEPLMNNFTEWHGNIIGPEGTLYEGGMFHFVIKFNHDHPR